jgi:Holliday junction resolvase RusA-like endonuclease
VKFAFFAEGVPQPQGSAKGFVVKSKATGKLRAVVTSDNPKVRPWRESVRDAARRAMEREGQSTLLLTGPLSLSMFFLMPPPQAVAKKFTKGRYVACTTRPDVDKLVRSILDALTGLVYADDGQVIQIGAGKAYQAPGRTPGVEIHIEALAREAVAPASGERALPLEDPTPEPVRVPLCPRCRAPRPCVCDQVPDLPDLPDEEGGGE